MPGYVPVIFDLAASRYRADTQGFFLAFRKYFPQGAPIPGTHRDGDFTKAKATGILIPEHPFASEGDTSTAIVREPMMQLASEYRPLQLGAYHTDDSRLLLIDETNFADAGGGIITWKRVWANIPQPRDRLASFAHSYQYISQRRPTLTLSEKVFTVTSRVRTEYFNVTAIYGFPPFQASRFEQFTETKFLERGNTNWNLTGDLFTTSDEEIVAEDSEVGYWKYPIGYRRTRYVPGPTLEFWGNEYAIPGT